VNWKSIIDGRWSKMKRGNSAKKKRVKNELKLIIKLFQISKMELKTILTSNQFKNDYFIPDLVHKTYIRNFLNDLRLDKDIKSCVILSSNLQSWNDKLVNKVNWESQSGIWESKKNIKIRLIEI